MERSERVDLLSWHIHDERPEIRRTWRELSARAQRGDDQVLAERASQPGNGIFISKLEHTLDGVLRELRWVEGREVDVPKKRSERLLKHGHMVI